MNRPVCNVALESIIIGMMTVTILWITKYQGARCILEIIHHWCTHTCWI